MSVISITITENVHQTIPGIPDTVALSTNIPSTIFYSLDNSIPNTYSNVYLSPILMPQNLLTVVLNIFATNGIDNSAIITKQYNAIVSEITTAAGDRLPHSPTTNLNNASTSNSLFPFGTSTPNTIFNYLNPAKAGTTVFDQSQPATPSGFDNKGNPAGFINQPSLDLQFKQIYSTTNKEGEVLPGVGNLPAKVTIRGKNTPVEFTQEQSSRSDKLFNPRAMVIFQDSTTEDPTDPAVINRSDFTLQMPETDRDGVLLFNNALDSPSTSGSFIKSYINPRTQMMTSYYYDNSVNRWIISSSPFQPTPPNPNALQGMVFGRSSSKIFNWIVYPRRFLI
jgi:hypothetical protein